MKLADKLAAFLDTTENAAPHLAGGWSSLGTCLGQQILLKIYPQPFDGHGFTTPGTAAHTYWQTRLVSGMVVFDHFLVIGHEQYVYLIRPNKPIRQSPIDTLLFNLKTQEFEIWDYKSIGYLAEVNDKPLAKNVLQVNLYAHLFKEMLHLDYYPKCRLIYINKINWKDLKIHSWTGQQALAEKAIHRMELIEHGVEDQEWMKVQWEDLIDGLHHWSRTRTPYRKDCRYCHHAALCLQLLGAAWDLDFKSIDDYAYFKEHQTLPGIAKKITLPLKSPRKKKYTPPNVQIDPKNEALY